MSERDLLIVVDVQNDFVDGVLGTKEAKETVPNIVKKVNDWDGPIIFTIDCHSVFGYSDTIEGQRIPMHCNIVRDRTLSWMPVDELNEVVSEKPKRLISIINKNTFMIDEKRTRNIIESLSGFGFIPESITLIGLVTDICVISNALLMRSLYPKTPVKVISDCCAGTTPELHEKALDVMRSCCIDVE